MEQYLAALEALTPISCVVRMILAILVGGIIGFERGKRGRAAGLRTHMLVSLGAALTAMTGIFITTQYGMGDPTRISASVVSGIGFLGAGMIIIRSNSQVTGLTTAAALWATSVVGLAIGGGFILGGVLGGVIISVTVSLMTVFEVKQKKDRKFFIEIDDVTAVNQTVENLRNQFTQAHNVDIMPAKSGLSGHVGIVLNIMEVSTTTDSVEKSIMTFPHVVFVVSE